VVQELDRTLREQRVHRGEELPLEQGRVDCHFLAMVDLRNEFREYWKREAAPRGPL
jgi:hypothetical protein